MRSTILTALVVLVAGTGAGIVANASWYDMDWVRKSVQTQEPIGDPPPEGGPKDGEIGIDAVLKHLADGSAVFIDAREIGDFEEGHIAGAIHLPSSDIYNGIETLMNLHGVIEDQKIIIYCGGGDCEASHNVADALRVDFSYQDVWIYKNGWEEVERSGKFGDYIEVGGEN